ncbi:hypothetical protein [Type-D symbiont of Plautia stali]|uniref:hypothetical protein n=1 Tax=Type-D symbiont of Plautia stali TaxID=1560356 RepID=UPI00073F582D|nr:hypothetical protein [Type-D symbiont of Plautia stali]
MISDERLEQISQCSDVATLFAYEQRQMARELLELRKAFSEPVCCIEPPELDYLSHGDDARVYWPKAAEHGDILLYRKPTDSTT